MKCPELVLPAGNLEKLKTAFLFGADAVYLGGKDFSLRAYAGNLSLDEIREGLDFAHERKKKAYVGVNIFAHNRDLTGLPAFLEELEALRVDGLIISDPGILRLAKKYAASIPLTISTQANISNYEAAAFYRDLGVQRIVLARELSLDEMEEIKRKVEIELEVFIHGAMCVSYSGRCLLSHYMTGRSANSGACAHPCRYKYALMEEKRPGDYYSIEEDERGSYILNSRDLCLLEYIPRLMDLGIEAFKVEGRMKSPLYVASTASIYQKAIGRYHSQKEAYDAVELENWIRELKSTASRPFTNGFIEGESSLLQDINKESLLIRADFCGIVRACRRETAMLEIEQRANFGPGDNLELYLPGGEILKLEVDTMYDQDLNLLDRARHPRQRILIPSSDIVPEFSILRRIRTQDEN